MLRAHQRTAARTTSKPSYVAFSERNRVSGMATLPTPQPMSSTRSSGARPPTFVSNPTSSSPTRTKSPMPTKRIRIGGRPRSRLPVTKRWRSIAAPRRYCIRWRTAVRSRETSVKGDDPLLPELVEDQQRVRLADGADLDERSDIPRSVDARQEESLVRREVHPGDL